MWLVWYITLAYIKNVYNISHSAARFYVHSLICVIDIHINIHTKIGRQTDKPT